MKAEKCEFHLSSVTFLGHIIGQWSIQMDAGKVWPAPDSRQKLQRFLGFANFYCRFIRKDSSMAAPLTSLTSTRRPFAWTSEADAAFQTLKQRFTSAPILHMPDPSLQFLVEVDASDGGVGAVLSQRAASDQKLHFTVPDFALDIVGGGFSTSSTGKARGHTWVPPGHVLDPQLIRDFHQWHPNQPTTNSARGPSRPRCQAKEQPVEPEEGIESAIEMDPEPAGVVPSGSQ